MKGLQVQLSSGQKTIVCLIDLGAEVDPFSNGAKPQPQMQPYIWIHVPYELNSNMAEPL